MPCSAWCVAMELTWMETKMSPFAELAMRARSRRAMRRSSPRVTTTSKPFLPRRSRRRMATSSVTNFSVSFDAGEWPGSLPPCPASMTTRWTERGKADADMGTRGSFWSAAAAPPLCVATGSGGMAAALQTFCGALPCEKYVAPISASGTSSSGARCSQMRAPRRSGRTARGGNPRIVSRFSATASRSSWRFTRSIFPRLIRLILRPWLRKRLRIDRPELHLAVLSRRAVPRIDKRRAHVERVLRASGVAPIVEVRLLRNRADRRVVDDEAPDQEAAGGVEIEALARGAGARADDDGLVLADLLLCQHARVLRDRGRQRRRVRGRGCVKALDVDGLQRLQSLRGAHPAVLADDNLVGLPERRLAFDVPFAGRLLDHDRRALAARVLARAALGAALPLRRVADRRRVFLDDVGQRGQLRPFRLRGRKRRLRLRQRHQRLRRDRAAVAGFASDLRAPAELLLVQLEDHGDHLARDFLLFFLVAGEVPAGPFVDDEAEIAVHAEGGAHHVHRAQQVRVRHVRQKLDVLLLSLGGEGEQGDGEDDQFSHPGSIADGRDGAAGPVRNTSENRAGAAARPLRGEAVADRDHGRHRPQL